MINYELEQEEHDLETEINVVMEANPQAPYSYNQLMDLPMLNGKTFKGNVSEEDPTVPEWAKNPDKPKYNVSEIEGMTEVSLEEINSWFEN